MKLFVIIFLLFFKLSYAQGLSGLNYETYSGGGSSPSPGALLSTGVVDKIEFYWGGGGILDSNRSDGVVVRFFGSYKVPGTGLQTFYFGIDSDDGQRLILNGETLADCWCDQGNGFRIGSINLQGGTTVPIEVWYYENGGGAFVALYWLNPTTGYWEIVPQEQFSREQTSPTPAVPVLCCGATSSPFEPDSSFKQRSTNFATNNNGSNRVTIEQIGSGSTILVTQSGQSNSTEISSNGSNNYISINQSTNLISLYNFSEITINGNNNNVSVTQNNIGGSKETSIKMDSNNTLNLQQYNIGNHYAEVNLIGNNKSVDLTQSGSANHMARIKMSGGSSSLILNQQGSTQQFYSIDHNCAQISCAAIIVNQPQ